VIALIAAAIGREAIASAEAYATVPLGGFSRNSIAAAFAETMTALGGGVRTYVIFDGDLRCKEAVEREVASLRRVGAGVHVWQRRELENYLLSPNALARAAHLTMSNANQILADVLEELEGEARLTLQTRRIDEHKQKIDPAGAWSSKTVLSNSAKEFDELWASEDGKLAVVDAKLAISGLNSRLQSSGKKTINLRVSCG
jgi:hypothetical protein